ncbi:hypothetical protein ABTN37_18975, partial [Acinetobacter baumannii]
PALSIFVSRPCPKPFSLERAPFNSSIGQLEIETLRIELFPLFLYSSHRDHIPGCGFLIERHA